MVWPDRKGKGYPNAPDLEYQLHKQFVMLQVNKVNFRKEFRVKLHDIRGEIDKLGLTVQWTMRAEAQEYHESLAVEIVLQESPENKDAGLKNQLEMDMVTSPAADETEDESENN